MRRIAKLLLTGIGAAAASYASYVAVTWLRFDRPKRSTKDPDPLLDNFIPIFEAAEHHQIHVAAPPEVTYAAATEMELEKSPIVRAIFKGRELLLRSKPVPAPALHGFIEQMKAIGWGVLAEAPGREIVMGAVTKPWEPNPVFRPIAPSEFAAFSEPDHVKIAWTLRADPADAGGSIFRTETRAVATDAAARKKFRRYWSLLSPGILLIRTAMMPIVRADAERRILA